MSDPIADMLTRIRNASERRHSHVAMPSSRLKVAIAGILREEGYIDGYDVMDSDPKRPVLRLKLRYTPERRSVISHLERVSRPGRRVYAGRREIPWVLSGIGIAILTTPKGVMTGQQARRENVGGEVLCYVW
jgi:small subunit ribosomal protein S8